VWFLGTGVVFETETDQTFVYTGIAESPQMTA
jgi:hypothetical protein